MNEQPPILLRNFPSDTIRKLLKANLPDGIKLRLEFDRKQPWQRSEWDGISCCRHPFAFTVEQTASKRTFLALVYIDVLGGVLGLHCFGKGGNVYTVTRQDASSRSPEAPRSRLKPAEASWGRQRKRTRL